MKESEVPNGEKNKRILLSDPNYLQNELHQIQVKLQEYEVVKSEVDALQTQITHGDKGAVYVRWGRKDCSDGNTTELVYSGYTGGSNYQQSGAAAEYVCLPPDPTWGPHKDIRTYAPAYMYGAEYEDPILFGMPDYKEDVPCAVCRSSTHSTSIMIPARTSCYPGWKEAYHGILSAGAYSHSAATQYVCVDGTPQTLTGGGNTDGNGKLFYQVRTVCGSLQCPPYENDKVLSCVVCLK
ncbi:Short-chain collagen C4 [Mizuhopecten yessoensis]|uniref:Short-chain collagen C4 n=2 Tax=Mizuhopecten yessoensis TaxID=6573 RepID=A0A210PE69_MIZYE|nr:Short-chain collagen C4 [Mizuhopecten yessoensis]